MGLLGNGFRDNLTGRISVATTNLNGCNPSTIPASKNLTAFRRNMLVGEGIANPQASVPQGVRPPVAWLMAQAGGGISSYRRGEVRVDGTADGELGAPRTAAATISIDGTVIGGLIVGATGSVSFTLAGTADILAVLNGEGAATVSIDGAADLGALASLVGATTITLDGAAEIMGLGYMTGTTEEAGLTVAGITNGVWNALLANYTTDGSAGKALATASSGGVDYGALADAVRAELGIELSAIVDVWRRHGLDSAAPLTQTATEISAAGITLAVAEPVSGTVTVTRQP